MIDGYLAGAFPRSPELIEATINFEKGKLGQMELEKEFSRTTGELIKLQVSKKFGYITDGMLRWNDLLRPFTFGLKALEVGPLTRWFDNNTFYRKPIIVNKLGGNGKISLKIVYKDQMPRKAKWKAILPALFTFAKLSENKYYRDKLELMFNYSKILRKEIKSLAEGGFSYIQLSDPSLVYRPFEGPIQKDELQEVKEALGEATKGIKVRTSLQTFFGDFAKLLPEVLDFPVDDLGFDLYKTNISELSKYKFTKGIALGLVDSRSSVLEGPAELINIAKHLIKSVYPSKIKEVFICPNTDLDFLPWRVAKKKLSIISKVINALRGEFLE
jgi:5-methyltetrahydropteroyltriglutamate--homocysteine methyltransferase